MIYSNEHELLLLYLLFTLLALLFLLLMLFMNNVALTVGNKFNILI